MKRAFTTLAAVLTIAVLAAACAGPEEAAPVFARVEHLWRKLVQQRNR